MYDIRFCRTDEIDKLQEFIYKHWKEDHIFTKNLELLKWQHYDKKNDRYNFVVAYNKADKAFDAILGFIPVHHYDENLSNNDIWLAIWKINKEKTKGEISGMDLFYYLRLQTKPDSIGAIGISDIARNIYKALGYKTGIINQYYFLNRSTNQFFIADAKVADNYEKSKISQEDYTIRRIKDTEELKCIKKTYKPYKSLDYIINRYLSHPIYKYVLYGIYHGEQLICSFITRKIKVANTNCIRIVDIYGSIEELGSIGNAMEQLLIDENAEYIDCLNYGIDENYFYNLGFRKRDNNVTIPNYFEPFVKQNVDIHFGYRSKYDDYIIFKGDSDQDRPNF